MGLERGTDLMSQPRRNRLAGRQPRGQRAELDRRGQDIALAYPVDERLALLPWNAEPRQLPGAGRDEAAQLAGQLDAGWRTQSQGLGGLGHLVDAQPPRHFVEEDIAGDLDAACQVDMAMTADPPRIAVESVVAKPHRPGAIDGEIV